MATEDNSTPAPSTSNSLFGIDTTLLTLFYKDAAQPGVRQVGKAIGTALELSNIALLPVKLYGKKKKLLYEKNLEDFRKKLADIPESDIVEAAPEIGVPILENLGKTTSDKIRELYLNLLANASSIDYVANTHPRFVSLLENITADEAKILDYINTSQIIPYIDIKIVFSLDGLSGIDESKFRKRLGMSMLHERVTMLEKMELLSLPDKSRFYLQNLEGLGLVRKNSTGLITSSFYDSLKEAFASLLARKVDNGGVETDEGSFELTETGKLFLLACKQQ